jgi:hypothetical protein
LWRVVKVRWYIEGRFEGAVLEFCGLIDASLEWESVCELSFGCA